MSRSAQHDDAGSGSQRSRIRPQEGYPDREREPLPTRVAGLPSLAEPYRRALDEALDDLGLDLGARAREGIDAHVRLLLAWNDAINLTAVRDPAAIARRHVADSLTAVPILRARRVEHFVDLGSGGGFPGIPLALVLPAREALLVESTRKKADFLRAAATVGDPDARTGIAIAAVRAESLAADRRHRARWPAVTARAVASLADLAELAFPLLRVGGILVAWKRGDVAAEAVAAHRALEALGGGRIDIADADLGALPEHRLVIIEKRGPTPDTFPRDPAARRRRPW